jgi:hypothetical protein
MAAHPGLDQLPSGRATARVNIHATFNILKFGADVLPHLVVSEVSPILAEMSQNRTERPSRFHKIQPFDNQYLILVLSPHILAAEHDLFLAYGSRTDNRRAPVSGSLSGYMAGHGLGHGLGYCGGVCDWGVLVVLIGILQIGNLKLSRL